LHRDLLVSRLAYAGSRPGKVSAMTGRLIKMFFPFLAVLLLAPWPVVYAYDVSRGMSGRETARIEVAEPSSAPSWHAFGRAVGGVTPGDLFYIDAGDNPADIMVTLYITNTQELVHCYRYLTLGVGVYVRNNDGGWDEASRCDGKPLSDTFLTLRNGQVGFTLAGCAAYRITIDGGCFYCATSGGDGSPCPQFFLTVD